MRQFTEIISKSVPPVITYLAYNLPPTTVSEIADWMLANDLPTAQSRHLRSGLTHRAPEGGPTITQVSFEPDHHDAAKAFRASFLTDDEAQRFRKLLNYDPETGSLTWRFHKRRSLIGHSAGWTKPDGVREFLHEGRRYTATRIIWLMQTGAYPQGYVVAKNRDPADLRWDNLEDRSVSETLQGRTWSKVSSYLGVTRVDGKWRAQIGVNSTTRSLGYFETEEEAARAYDAKARELHGDKARLNFPDDTP